MLQRDVRAKRGPAAFHAVGLLLQREGSIVLRRAAQRALLAKAIAHPDLEPVEHVRKAVLAIEDLNGRDGCASGELDGEPLVVDCAEAHGARISIDRIRGGKAAVSIEGIAELRAEELIRSELLRWRGRRLRWIRRMWRWRGWWWQGGW